MLEASYAEKLLDLGFGAVVSPGYRLAPTISAYGGPVIDSLDAYRWAQTELPQLLAGEANVKLDGDRLVAYGQSSGASIALLMVSTSYMNIGSRLSRRYRTGTSTQTTSCYFGPLWVEVLQG